MHQSSRVQKQTAQCERKLECLQICPNQSMSSHLLLCDGEAHQGGQSYQAAGKQVLQKLYKLHRVYQIRWAPSACTPQECSTVPWWLQPSPSRWVEIYMVEIPEGILVPHEPQKSERREGQKLLQRVLETLHLSVTFHFLPFCEFGVVFVKLTKILCRLFVGIPCCVQCRVGLAGRFAHISLVRLHVLSNCAIWLATFHLSGLELVNLTTLYTAYPSTSFTCDRMTGGFSSSCLFQEQGLTLSLLAGLMLVHKP
jgi:hypothetical protein